MLFIQTWIQTLIYTLEVGAGSRFFRIIASVLAVVLVALLYDIRVYQNFSAPEAMDTAQLARNISEGNLFFGVVALTFLIARKLFNTNVALLSMVLVLGCEILWHFAVSGLSTMLLMVIFMGLTWCILKIQETILVREEGSQLSEDS